MDLRNQWSCVVLYTALPLPEETTLALVFTEKLAAEYALSIPEEQEAVATPSALDLAVAMERAAIARACAYSRKCSRKRGNNSFECAKETSTAHTAIASGISPQKDIFRYPH